MTEDLSTAFDLVARAESLAGVDPLDRISLRNLVVETEIGAFEIERGVKQRLGFDVVVEVRSAKTTDDVDRILSYDKLSEAIALELATERVALLETLAEHIAGRILREPLAERVFLRIQKLDRGPGALGVEIVRSAVGVGVPEHMKETVAAQVVFVGAEVSQDDLRGLLDRRGGKPLLLCTDLLREKTPVAGTEAVQRRIDLLALDQAAWVLASREPRLHVVASRAELDWALRRCHLAVWAPSRMVLDAIDGPAGTNPVDLAAWVAAELGAPKLHVCGLSHPADASWPVPLVMEGTF